MIQTSINLPKKLRLDVHLVRRRGDSIEEPLLPSVREILHIRRGSRFSRIFTHILSHKSFKRLLGANIAAAVVISGFVPAQANFDIQAEQNIVTAEVLNTTTEKGTRYPVEEIKLTQGYKFWHPGIDLDGLTGDPIYPIMNGRVKAISRSRFAYGNAILVEHGSGLESLYAHLSKISVKEGDRVDIKNPIGEMGATGRASGDHLHFEVHDNGRPINPYTILPKVK